MSLRLVGTSSPKNRIDRHNHKRQSYLAILGTSEDPTDIVTEMVGPKGDPERFRMVAQNLSHDRITILRREDFLTDGAVLLLHRWDEEQTSLSRGEMKTRRLRIVHDDDSGQDWVGN